MSDPTSAALGEQQEQQQLSSAIREPSPFLLGYGLFAGIVWWSIHLWACSALTPAACEHGITWVLNVLTVVTAIGAAAGIVAGARLRRYAIGDGSHVGRTRLLGELAVIFSVASVALILLEGYPVLFIDVCAR